MVLLAACLPFLGVAFSFLCWAAPCASGIPVRSCSRRAPSVCAHMGLSQVVFPGPSAGCSSEGQHRWNAHPCAQGAGESSGLVFAYLSASVLFQLFGDHSGDTVSASPGQVSHLQITTSEHLSYETSLEAALSTLITAVLTTLLAVYPSGS